MRSAREALITEPFHLSSLGQMPNVPRKAGAELLATSRVVLSGPASKAAAHRLLSTPDGQQVLFICKASSPGKSFLNHVCTMCSLAVPGPNALLIVQVVSAALQPILNSNKKIT